MALKKIQDDIRFKILTSEKSVFAVLRPKKKLLQFIQRITKKNLAEIGEPMVPDRDMAGCFRKYLPTQNFDNILKFK
jgi:hypothetical protein